MRNGIIFYTDGGARPNPGSAGAGIHGYYYSPDKPKKGSGEPNHILTAGGYVEKAVFAPAAAKTYDHFAGEDNPWHPEKLPVRTDSIQVTPISYIDGHCSFIEALTNNVGEIVAATKALEKALEFEDLGSVTIFTDSQYVRDGLITWYPGWVKNNWFTSAGKPVSNKGYWIALAAAKKALVDRGIVVTIEWIKGHAGMLGNEVSDAAATAGVMESMRAREGSGKVHPEGDFVITPADGYWKVENHRHAFLCQHTLYFNTHPEYYRPGIYMSSNRTKDVYESGKRNGQESFSVVKLKAAEPLIEAVVKHQMEVSAEKDEIFSLSLDRAYSPTAYRNWMRWGKLSFINSRLSSDTFSLDNTVDQPLTHHFKPVGLVYRTADILNHLENILNNFEAKREDIIVTELTDLFYEVKSVKSGKTDKEVCLLKPEYKVGHAKQDAVVNYRNNDILGKCNITLSFGIDIPDRNALRRFEELKPRLYVVTWSEAAMVFRHATIIVTEGGESGIWCGYFSNIRFADVI